MKTISKVAVAFVALFNVSSAVAAGGVDQMVGKWSWEGFVIVVNKCPETEVCAKVLSGPKNVGLQMIKSKLMAKGDGFVGKIAHPQTGDTYNAKLRMADANTWHLDGCTDKNVCASGDFKRIK